MNSPNSLDHFLGLAIAGGHQGCSSGEHKARKLALAILEYGPGLDSQALEGAAEYLTRAPLAPIAARQLIAADRRAS